MKIVIKVGGALFAQGIEPLVEDLKDVSKNNQVVIVHGGGPQITDVGEKMGREAKHYKTPKGMKTRYTDSGQIENIKMAIGGQVNKNIVEMLRKVGVNAFGFTGLDGAVVTAKRKKKIMVINERGRRQILRGEYSGKPQEVDSKILNFLLENDYVPIIGSMCVSKEGDALNVDGDRVAVAVADAIHADKFVSLTDVEGIFKNMESKEIISALTLVEAESLLKGDTVKGGMKKKVYAAVQALKGNVKEFVIYSGQAEHPLTDILRESKGTRIKKE